MLKVVIAGKIQGILPISPIGSSQIVQNIAIATTAYEITIGALEQGNFGSYQGIELGNQLLSGKGSDGPDAMACVAAIPLAVTGLDSSSVRGVEGRSARGFYTSRPR